ncbi:MAG: head-tail connector protein [Faecalibacterium sp.]|nr:head-tail connector protein [Ruminococcus sp.]MCM1392101.1 head-tail connector protein [Ruminococcus sp.]MCM1485798.1 head-tail connector protein [Faecalibacterium sp.]
MTKRKAVHKANQKKRKSEMFEMKMSEITISDVLSYMKVDQADVGDRREIENILASAKQYVLNETGLSAEECDRYDDLTIAVMILCNDMFDNRSRYVNSSSASPSLTVESILGFHRHNLL